MQENYKEEEWKDIPGYEGLYQVSDLGRVKSLSREIMNSNKSFYISKEKLLKLLDNSRGYLFCHLSKNNKQKSIMIHKLVVMSFLGHVPDGTMKVVVDHKNGLQTDNRLENLQLISQRENASKNRKSSSKYVGVSWYSLRKLWKSEIYISSKRVYLGRFTCELEASQMYQKALQNLHLYEGCNKTFREQLKNEE